MIVKIKIKAPHEDVEDTQLAEFIIDALETWGGQLHPNDPLFKSLEVEYVSIGRVKYVNPTSS